MLTRDEARKLAQKVIALSTFPECQVNITSSEQAYTRFANNGITTAALGLRHTVAITVSREGRSGTMTVNDLDDASLKSAVKKAEEIAAIAPVNPERLAALGPQEYPTVSDFDERTANARSPEMIPHVKRVIDHAKERKQVAAGLILRTRTASAIANKAGLFGFHESADSQLTTTFRMPDGSSSGWAGQPSTKLSEIDSAALAAAASEKCARWKNPQKIQPGNYTVVLEPTATGDLVRLMAGAFNARQTEEGRTFLSKRGGGSLLGEKVFPEFVTLRSDPFDSRQPSSPWTGDLLPTRAITWVDKGVIANLAYDRYWSGKTGKQPTPNPGGGFGGGGGGFGGGGASLTMEGGDATLEQLIASVERGLLVTHFWYIRFVNPQTLQHTGLTRDGLFLIENGKITTPVTNLRFLESPVRLLKNTTRLGKAVRVRGLEGGLMIAPALVATDFPLPSISDAI
ncbi:MAG TPA: TldD/PmbA family protein [Candidatus Acidoferrum sp.]|jgi:predicted Zn-dependent protease|nr:TldD/PmbA family protein [Candidatus Acidoferrum sp.]